MDDDKDYSILGFIWMMTLTIGTFGFILHTLIIMPIKYAVWHKLEYKSNPDDVVKTHGYNFIAYGFLAIMLVGWIIEFSTNRWGFTPMSHFIYFAIIGLPVYYTLTGIINEFESIKGDTKFHMKNEYIAMNIEFVVRLIFGIILTVLLIAAAIQSDVLVI